jgi:hypothetical protein
MMTTWWFAPIDAFRNNSLTASTFDRRDLVPVAYALFAFVFGATVGLLLRRTLPAMVVTLFGFIGLRYVVEDYLRPHYMAPLTQSSVFNPLDPGVNFGPGGLPSSDQMVSQETVTATGRVIAQNGNIGPGTGMAQVASNGTVSLSGFGKCAGKVTNPLAQTGRSTLNHPVHVQAGTGGFSKNMNSIVEACSRHYGLRQITTYQTLNRYWPFQIYESTIFIAAALVLTGFSLWWLRRRVTP